MIHKSYQGDPTFLVFLKRAPSHDQDSQVRQSSAQHEVPLNELRTVNQMKSVPQTNSIPLTELIPYRNRSVTAKYS